MNEADRKAFEDTCRKLADYDFPEKYFRTENGHYIAAGLQSMWQAWQAACEHKQREVDALKARVARLEDAISYSGVYKDCQELCDVLEESEQQSLVEVRARAVLNAIVVLYSREAITKEVGKVLQDYANEMLQEAKDA